MQENRRTDPISNRIRIYSFIWTVLVIWIHAVQPGLNFLEDPADAWWGQIQNLLGNTLGQFAVPGFFVLSGYLFFRNADTAVGFLHDSFSASHTDSHSDSHTDTHSDSAGVIPFTFYKKKLAGRIRSLVIPYLCWNGIYLLIYLILGKTTATTDTFINGIFFYKYNPVFWYLKQLIGLTVLTPLIGWLLKERRRAVWTLLCFYMLAVFYNRLPMHPVNEDALSYYAFGSALALHRKKEIEQTPPAGWRRPLLWCAALLTVWEGIYFYGGRYGRPELMIFGAVGGRLLGTAGLYMLLSMLDAGSKPTPRFMEYNFFIYAVHYLELRFFQRIWGLFFQGAAASMVLYILMPVLCIAAGVAAAGMLRRIWPAAFRVLTGGRA